MNTEPFVEVLTGRIMQGVRTQEGTHFVSCSHLRGDGKPDLRAKKHLAQIYLAGNGRYFVGRYAPVVPEREAHAEQIRRDILAHHEQIARLEHALQTLYCTDADAPDKI